MLRRLTVLLPMLGACGAQAPAQNGAQEPRETSAITVEASPTGTVAGTARGVLEDAGFAPLRAKVILRSSDGGIEFQARCDPTGEFFFGPIPAGSYELVVTAPGWVETTTELNVAAGEALYPDIALEPAPEDGR